jgi:transposase
MSCCASSSPAAQDGVLSANRAAKLLRSVHPAGPAAVERKRLAVDLLADVRRLDQQIAATRSRIADAVEDSKTTLLELHGVGPIVAAYILGHVANPARFATPQRFASYNGTAPIEASSGPRKRHRLNPPGNRKLNHAMHLIAVTQIRNHTPWPRLLRTQAGRGQVKQRSPARPEAAHQRRRLAPTPGRPQASLTSGPGRTIRGDSESSAAGLHPDTGTSDKSLPDPPRRYARRPGRASTRPRTGS